MTVRSFPTRLIRTVCVALAATLTAAQALTSPVSADTATSSLSVTSDPMDAAVYVDGRLAGRTPLQLDAVSVGDHRVRVVKTGYLDNSRVVGVRTGRPNTVTVRLTRDDHASATAIAPGGSSKKWLWIGLGVAAVGGGAAALLGGSNGGGGGRANRSPVVSGVTSSSSFGLMSATSINFSAGASDPDGDGLSYSWDFGNGTTSTSPTPSTVFTSAGVFTVRVTVSDGSASASSATTVTIRSMTGTWRGSAYQGVFTLTQNGTTVTGSYIDEDGPGTLSAGAVSGSSPNFRITISQPGFQIVFTGNPDSTINAISGTIVGNIGGGSGPYTMTRQ